MTADGTEGAGGDRQRSGIRSNQRCSKSQTMRGGLQLGDIPIRPKAVTIGSKQFEEVAVTAREIEDWPASSRERFSEYLVGISASVISHSREHRRRGPRVTIVPILQVRSPFCRSVVHAQI